MPIINTEISIFQSPAVALVNPVNTAGVMGAGLARQFKDKYPEIFEPYRRLCADGRFQIGGLYIYGSYPKTIVCLATKDHFREPARIEYIERGLWTFASHYAQYGITSVAFPRLGCGLGQLSWEKDVQFVMEEYLGRLPIPVYIHHYG